MTLPGIAEVFVSSSLMERQDAERYVESMLSSKTSFLDEVLKDKKYNMMSLAVALSEYTAFPVIDLKNWKIPDGLAKDIDKKPFEEAGALPLWKKDNSLLIAISDPINDSKLKQLKFNYSDLSYVIVSHDKLMSAFATWGKSANQQMDELTNNLEFSDDFGEVPAEAEDVSDMNIDDEPIVKLFHKAILDAVAMGASDLHFEPFEHSYKIRFRIDGGLVIYAEPPIHIKDKLANIIKVRAQMDPTQKFIPQDGRMSFKLGGNKKIDFRVNTCPVVRGEKVCMRILDPNSVKVSIDQLGYDPEQKEMLLNAVHRPYGMVLVTGPTGSGKTVSLYTCLNILNKPDINISTAEDPAEIDLPGINQVNVDEKKGLTFAAALKAFLRQDPDIIMVGEIRDLGTAEIAIKAAQTGHMVLSTLHTNTAPETVTRLISMGIPSFNVASALTLVTAQRLGRRLCSCKKEVEYTDKVLLEIGFKESQLKERGPIYGPVGCEKCRGTGYKGRVGVYQVMPITDAIKRIILSGGNAMDIAEQAQKEGINDLRQSGLIKVLQGHTSIEEIMAITNED